MWVPFYTAQAWLSSSEHVLSTRRFGSSRVESQVMACPPAAMAVRACSVRDLLIACVYRLHLHLRRSSVGVVRTSCCNRTQSDNKRVQDELWCPVLSACTLSPGNRLAHAIGKACRLARRLREGVWRRVWCGCQRSGSSSAQGEQASPKRMASRPSLRQTVLPATVF